MLYVFDIGVVDGIDFLEEEMKRGRVGEGGVDVEVD